MISKGENMHVVIEHQIDEIDKAALRCKEAADHFKYQAKARGFEEAEMQLIAARNLLVRLNDPDPPLV